MRKLLCCALALLTPSLLASTINSSQHESSQQLEHSGSLENATKRLSFNDLPIDIKRLVFQKLPLSSPLVCRDWVQVTEKRRASELEAFLGMAKQFEAAIDADEAKDGAGYIERHFKTPAGMHRMLSRIIASSYERVYENAVKVGSIVDPDLLETFMSQSTEVFLEKYRLMSMFLDLLLRSENQKSLLFDVLSGEGNFREIPLRVRQFVAKQLWSPHSTTVRVCQLFYFLSSFHDKFDMFKESLVGIHSDAIARACVEIALGINCTMPSADDRLKLLGSIKLLFYENSFIQKVCLFCEKLSPSLPISEIHKVVDEYPSLAKIAFNVLRSSSEHVTATWCIRELGVDATFIVSTVKRYLVFSHVFLEKHQLSKHQLKLLKGCDANDLLCNLPSDLTGLDTKALVEWVKQNVEWKKILSFDNLVIFYSLDDDDNALSNFAKSSSALKNNKSGGLEFSQIALGIGCGRYLNRDKKAALLKLLYPEKLEAVKTHLDGDRKELLFQVVLLLGNQSYDRLVDRVSELDFSLLMEACLGHSKVCKLPPSCFQDSKLTLQVIFKYIESDVKKANALRHFPKYYRVMMFLLTDHDEIADYLIKAKMFKDFHLECYFPKVHSDWKALRAAKRIHRLRNPQKHQ